MNKECYLVLENGMVFRGKSFGAEGEITAEVVFTTGMTGYLETLTDKSYYGQMVAQTFPLIGNYGVIPHDFEGTRIGPSAYIVNDWCQAPSNFRSEGDIDTFLRNNGVIGIYGVDTRALTKTIRESGVMNGRIVNDISNVDWKEIRDYRIHNAVKSVTVNEVIQANRCREFAVSLIDYGYKHSIVKNLEKRGCDVTICPSYFSAEEILAQNPDGIMLSNGPGDPAENTEIIECLKKLISSGVPIFGICLGHQLLALANGFRTEKLKYGHRGGNQPVRDTVTQKVYITSQNHGYAVVTDSICKEKANLRFVNVNDMTCEGIEYTTTPAFSVQFHPEASAGPRDAEVLFDLFIDRMRKNR